MRRMGFSVFWAATLLTTLALSADSQNAEPYPLRKDRPTPVGLTPPAASYTGITLGAFNPTSEPRKERAPIGLIPPTAVYPSTAPGAFNPNFGQKEAGQYGLGTVVPMFLAPPLYGPSLPANSAPVNSVKPPAVPSDPNAQALTDQQGVMADQLEQLSAEVNRLKGRTAQPVPPPSSSRAAGNPEPPAPGAPLILILQNGQRLQAAELCRHEPDSVGLLRTAGPQHSYLRYQCDSFATGDRSSRWRISIIEPQPLEFIWHWAGAGPGI